MKFILCSTYENLNTLNCFVTAFILVITCTSMVCGQGNRFSTTNGTIQFTSNAPLELISAASKKLEGVIDIQALTFAFSVPVRTFEGFNNGLQQQHFYENYMETDRYPHATFSGKLIEDVDLSTPGTYQVRAKGQLHIHGRSVERILRVEMVSNGGEIKISSQFFVPLSDHQIEVPRIVNQKIAQSIDVIVHALLLPVNKS